MSYYHQPGGEGEEFVCQQPPTQVRLEGEDEQQPPTQMQWGEGEDVQQPPTQMQWGEGEDVQQPPTQVQWGEGEVEDEQLPPPPRPRLQQGLQ